MWNHLPAGALLAGAIAVAAPTMAQAQAVAVPVQGAPATDVAARGAPVAGPPPLTFHGVTIYGAIDVGVTWQSHGVPYSGSFAPSVEYVISKNSGGARTEIVSNALSQSKFGLKGREKIGDDLAVVFQAEMQFVPTSLRLADALRAEVKNNGRPLAEQSTNGDSSKTGQLFAGQAYFGLSSKALGTLTFGRQWSLMLDNILAYDPVTASHAFSIIGYQGAAQAGASTEDARLDRSLKYAIRQGHARLTGMFQFGDEQLPATRAYGADVGYDWRGLSVDATYMHVNDTISASPLSAAQFAVLPANSLAATVADTNAFAAFAKYGFGRFKAFSGVERISFHNPDHPITPGYHTIGGYLLSAVNNAAYPRHRLLTYSWAGIRYAATRRLDITAAYYRVDQNSYGLVKCEDASSARCSGQLNAGSLVATYRLTRRLDVYTGAMYSAVANGLASGFLHSSTVDPTLGARLTF